MDSAQGGAGRLSLIINFLRKSSRGFASALLLKDYGCLILIFAVILA